MTSAPAGRVEPIRWAGDHLVLLDQRRLPAEETYLECRTASDVAAAISDMVVRGAPAIGIAAAYALVLAAQSKTDLDTASKQLEDARPTAVNLRAALNRMRAISPATAQSLLAEAQDLHTEDREQNRRMSVHALGLLQDPVRILTHCNTGALATGGHGTALGVIRSAHEQGRLRQVWATETRPWLQGARLTAWELQREGIAVRLLADGAAAQLMARGEVDWVVVGADRIAANGDVANKIGTYALAIVARHHGLGFMVVAPTSTFDLDCPDGSHIPIEERPASELTTLAGANIAPPEIGAHNPVFDVTPAALITALVCERGVISPVSEAQVRVMVEGPQAVR